MKKWMVEFEWTYPCGREVKPMAIKMGFETREAAVKWANDHTTDGTVSWYETV